MKRAIRLSGALIAALAIIIGCIGKFKPTLFMALPFPCSILLWLSTGNTAPPFLKPDPWLGDEAKTWTKPGDLVVSVGGKSGTTFMLYCAHQIRLKGADDADELFSEVNQATIWPELIQSRHGSWAEQKNRYNTTILPDGTKLKDRWDNERYPFRIFKSHYSPREIGGDTGTAFLPVTDNPQLKFLAMTRNGLDVVSSLVKFWSAHTDDFRRMWGGFPPSSSGNPDVDAETRLQEVLPGGLLHSFYFDYVIQWWKMRNEPNVLLLHYSDTRKDLKGTVTKLANFLGVSLTESEHARVTERCSIDHMRQNEHMFRISLPLNTDADMWDRQTMRLIAPREMIRTGLVGGYKDLFNEEQIARWRKAEEDVFGSFDPQLLLWAQEGGPSS